MAADWRRASEPRYDASTKRQSDLLLRSSISFQNRQLYAIDVFRAFRTDSREQITRGTREVQCLVPPTTPIGIYY